MRTVGCKERQPFKRVWTWWRPVLMCWTSADRAHDPGHTESGQMPNGTGLPR